MKKEINSIVAIVIGIFVFLINLSICAYANNPAQQQYNNMIVPEERIFYNNDIRFNKLQDKFTEAIDILNDEFFDKINPNDPYYKDNWVRMTETEGCNYYSLNYKYIANKYKKFISQEYYLWLMFLDATSETVKGGGLMTQTDNVRKYIIFMENFINNYPNFVRINDVKMLESQYLYMYMFGLDNTPIFDKYDTKNINPDYRKSYETFLAKNKDSKYYPMVSEFYTKVKKNNYLWDNTFENWHLNNFKNKYFNE